MGASRSEWIAAQHSTEMLLCLECQRWHTSPASQMQPTDLVRVFGVGASSYATPNLRCHFARFHQQHCRIGILWRHRILLRRICNEKSALDIASTLLTRRFHLPQVRAAVAVGGRQRGPVRAEHGTAHALPARVGQGNGRVRFSCQNKQDYSEQCDRSRPGQCHPESKGSTTEYLTGPLWCRLGRDYRTSA
jgi:hypothetical protein